MRITELDHPGCTSVAISPRGDRLASFSSDDMHLRMWSWPSGAQLHATRVVNGGELAWSPDGKLLAGGYVSFRVMLYDVGAAAQCWETEDAPHHAISLAFSRNNTLLAAGGDDGPIRIYDVAARTEVARFDGHERRTESLAFSPDGTLLASGGSDGKLRLWDVKNGALVKSITRRGRRQGITRIAFAADGRTLYAGNDFGEVTAWTVPRLQRVASWQGCHDRPDHDFTPVVGLCVLPNGDVATTAVGGSLIVWRDGTEVRRVSLEDYIPVFNVASDPDGTLAVAAAKLLKLEAHD